MPTNLGNFKNPLLHMSKYHLMHVTVPISLLSPLFCTHAALLFCQSHRTISDCNWLDDINQVQQ